MCCETVSVLDRRWSARLHSAVDKISKSTLLSVIVLTTISSSRCQSVSSESGRTCAICNARTKVRLEEMEFFSICCFNTVWHWASCLDLNWRIDKTLGRRVQLVTIWPNCLQAWHYTLENLVSRLNGCVDDEWYWRLTLGRFGLWVILERKARTTAVSLSYSLWIFKIVLAILSSVKSSGTGISWFL